MKKLLALLLFVATPVFAQPVQQSGAITPTHPAMWKTNGVIGDGGTPFNGALSGLGVTFSGQGICQNSAPISGPFNRICLGTTTSGGGLLTFNNFGGGAGGLVFNVNGVNYPFPFSGTGTVTSITAGANITLTPNPCISTCTIAATGGGGGGGTVTSVAGTNANGFTLAISNPTSTPNITIGTSISGFLQGNGVSMGAATTTGSGSTLVLATSPALTTPTIAGETVSGTANFTGTFQIGGNTMTFPATAATLVYKIGAFVSGDCLQASGTAGGIADAGAACGSGGGGGGSTAHRQDFVAPGGFTPGSTTSLTLSSAPVSQNAVTVTFDGVTQAGNTWSLTGSVVSFDAAIPLNVAVVDISWLSASISGGTVTSVGLADNSTTPIFTITGTPVTLSGTLSETLMVQTANTVFAGPTTGAAAQPTFRAIVPADLPLATSGAFGAVKGDGSTLTIGSGIISCTTGTTSQLGCLKVDGTIITVSAGAITVPKSSHTVFGVVETDGSTITNSTGVISCTTATSSQIGCVEPDNVTITISAGVITAVGSSLTVGSTISGSCTSGYVVYSNDGVVGCENLAGGGNVSNSGTPTNNQLAIWTNATTIKGVTALPAANFPALTGDVTTTAASLATTVAAIQGNTVTIGGTITTAGNVTFSGAHAFTGTLTADTSVTFPTSGTLVNSGVTTLSSLVSIGTVTTGTWDATVVAGQYGGTGVANTGSTLTLGGSLATTGSNSQTLAFSSAASYIYTYPLNTGTLAELNFAQTWTAAQTFNIASTVASSSGAALDDVKIQAATSTLTGTTTVTKFNKVSLYQPTITDSSSVTVTDAATLYIDNAPAAAGSVTITNAWAIRVGAGNVSFPGTGNLLGTITSGTWNGGVIGAAYGGTGLATLTAHALIAGNGASAPNFIAPGANNNVLTSNGTDWVSSAPASGGTCTTLATLVASSSATLSYTGLSATYNTYKFDFQNLLPASNNVQLQTLYSINGGSSYLTTGYTNADTAATTSSVVMLIIGSGGTYGDAAVANAFGSGIGISGQASFSNPNNAVANSSTMSGQATYYDFSATAVRPGLFAGTNSTASAVNAIEWKFSSGNIASGNILVSGCK